MKRKITTILQFVWFVMLWQPASVWAQSVNFSTVIPSPIGSYDRLRLIPQSGPPPGTCVHGEIYYDSTLQALQICNSSGVWESVGSVWQRTVDVGNSIEYVRLMKDQESLVSGGGNLMGWNAIVNRFVDQAYEDAGPNFGGIAPQLDVFAAIGSRGVILTKEGKVSWLDTDDEHGHIRMNSSNNQVLVDAKKTSTNQFLPISLEGRNILLQTRDDPAEISIDAGLPTANRNVGVGLTNPQQMLDVREAMQGRRIHARNHTFNGYLFMEPGNSTTDPIVMGGFDQSVSPNQIMKMKLDGNPLMFQANSGGNVGIGTTSPATKLDLAGKAVIRALKVEDPSFNQHLTVGQSGGVVNIVSKNPLTTAYTRLDIDASNLGLQLADFNGPGLIGNVGIGFSAPTQALAVNGQIHVSGTLTPAEMPLPSDRRLKINIEPLEGSLEKVLALNGVYFYWKDPEQGSERQIGLIAQDVEAVFPEMVTLGQGDYKVLTYDKMVAPLIDAVNTLKKKNDELKKRIQILEEQKKMRTIE
ncbi:MAG: tail fiber domain-containing protein [Candidatus Omnitrophica bacterium]|nr:tail fiber domain-containing protein [Candidatus Omnitrophota bacterium]